MKRKKIILLTGLIAGITLMGGCAKSEDSKETTTEMTTEMETQAEPEYEKTYVSYNVDTGIAVHDPSIFKDNGKYYIFGSHLAQGYNETLYGKWTALGTQGYSNATLYNGPLWESLAEPFEWAGGKGDADHQTDYGVWAPDVIYNPYYKWDDGSEGAYMLYSCTSATYIRSALIYSVSKTAEGPYDYEGMLVQSGFSQGDQYDDNSEINKNIANTNWSEATGQDVSQAPALYFNNGNYNNNSYPNAIDPTVFFDEEGRMWMTYGSWSGGIFILELDKTTGEVIHNYETGVDDGFTDTYFGKRIAGGSGVSIEAPYILYSEETGYYYLFVSYGWLGKDGGYNIRSFRSENPDGPYVDVMGLEGTKLSGTGSSANVLVGVKFMGGYTFPSLATGYVSPGHNSAMIDDDGKMFVVYHTRFESAALGEAHQPRVHQMFFNEDGWLCAAPFQYTGETISETGYENEDITGMYYVVMHKRENNTVPVENEVIYLNSDGTITGDYEGTWTVPEGSPYITIAIDKYEYKGVVIKMTDEAGNETVDFTSVGTNGQSLWGVKYTK